MNPRHSTGVSEPVSAVDVDLLHDLGKALDPIDGPTYEADGRDLLASEPMQRLRAAWYLDILTVLEQAQRERDEARAEREDLLAQIEVESTVSWAQRTQIDDLTAEVERLRAAVPDLPDEDYGTWNRNRYFMVDNLHEVVRSRQQHPFDDFNRGYELGLSWSLLRMGVTEAGSPERETQLKPWLEAHRGDIDAAAADTTTDDEVSELGTHIMQTIRDYEAEPYAVANAVMNLVETFQDTHRARTHGDT